jgi:hypothetical protein
MTLLTIPNFSPQLGKLPALPEGYLGYFQSQRGQLVFVYGLRQRQGLLYASGDGFRPHICSPGQPPRFVQPLSPESQWLSACWETALAQAMNAAMENLFSGLTR